MGRPAGLVAIFLISLALQAGTAVLGASANALPLSHLGVYYDGNLYLEIARSFPLPYAPEGPHYAGQAPLYPGLIWALRVLSPGAWFDWGLLALVASWVPAALASCAFFEVARRLGVEPFWSSLAFATANARWLQMSATAHPESLAVALALLALGAFLDGRVARAGALLALATLARYPAVLLVAPFAAASLAWRRPRELRTLGWFTLPLLGLLLQHLYLAWRIPGFTHVAAAHQVFWRTGLTWPFEELLTLLPRWLASGNLLWLPVTYAFLLASLAAVWVGARSRRGEERLLAGWVAVVIGFHACLDGAPAAQDFARLALLAWPPVVLLLWPRIARRLGRPPLVLGLLLLTGYGIDVTRRSIADAVALQNRLRPDYFARALARLDSDRPEWVDFSR